MTQLYPMRLTAPDGSRSRVFNKDEHDAMLAKWETDRLVEQKLWAHQKTDDAVERKPGTPAQLEGGDSHAVLVAEAKKLGVKVDGRWSDERITKAIASAK